MLRTTYTISYNTRRQGLEFKYEFFFNNAITPLLSLFNDFWLSLARILDVDSSSVYYSSYQNSDYAISNIIFYSDNIQCNEKIMDILFLHGKYRDYIYHCLDFLTREKFVYWQNATKNVDKPSILRALYQDNKISYAYLLKYSAYNSPSLYELAKSSVFIKIFGEEAAQVEKIDRLPLPPTIKKELKYSF